MLKRFVVRLQNFKNYLVGWLLTLNLKYATKVMFYKLCKRYNTNLINCSLTHSRTIYSPSTQHHVLKLTEWGEQNMLRRKLLVFLHRTRNTQTCRTSKEDRQELNWKTT